jgi:hypothetical protein
VGFVHTALGIDHSLPFVVLAKARGWSLPRTLWITTLCGLAHVLSSVLISGVGLAIGIAGTSLAWFDDTRGSWAAWMLVGFGVAYALFGLWKRESSTEHTSGDDLPAHRVMPALLVIFALGPCEALLPLLTAGGALLSFWEAAMIAAIFSLATMTTMTTMVALGYLGANLPVFRHATLRLASYTHVLAGVAIALSGITIQLLGI